MDARRGQKAAEAAAVVVSERTAAATPIAPRFPTVALFAVVLFALLAGLVWLRRRAARETAEAGSEAASDRASEEAEAAGPTATTPRPLKAVVGNLPSGAAPARTRTETREAAMTSGRSPPRGARKPEASPAAKPEKPKALTPEPRPAPRKATSSPEEPRPPRSAFVYYGLDMRHYLEQRNPDKGLREIGGLVHALWAELEEDGRKPYELKAKADEERYWRESRALERAKRRNPPRATTNLEKPPSPAAPGFAGSPEQKPPRPAAVAPSPPPADES